MGLLTTGEPLGWPETKPLVDHIKKHGIIQFINLYHRLKNRQGDCLRWGDEIEYILVHFDDENRKATVSLRGADLLQRLQATEQLNAIAGGENKVLWRPEYAAYMLEATPGTPYGALLACFNVVEANMRVRRREAQKLLKRGEHILSVGSFFRLGCDGFTRPPFETTPQSEASCAQSLFFPDDAIFSAHPRFKNLTKNIRLRRGEKVAINVPIFKDEHTPDPFIEDFTPYGLSAPPPAALPNHIYMDAMGFGMGCCCLQVTFQSVDDRTREERGLDPLKNNKFLLPKSRYDTTDSYIYACSEPYNDTELVPLSANG